MTKDVCREKVSLRDRQGRGTKDVCREKVSLR